MATSLIKQIEAEFSHLSPDEQLSLLERLVKQFRVGGWGSRGLQEHPLRELYDNPEIRKQLEGLRPEFHSAEGDLLRDSF